MRQQKINRVLAHPATKRAAIGAGVGAQWGSRSGALHQQRGTTNSTHPRLQGAVGGMFVGAAAGVGSYAVSSHFKNSVSHHTDRSRRNGA